MFIKYLFVYLLTTLVFFAIDLLWLGVIARNLYQKHIGHLMADQINWPAAIIFYLFFIVGILVFAVFPAAEKESLLRALALGAFLGALTYATYDLTNLATLKGWPVGIVVIDIAWGMVLTGLVSGAGYFIHRWVMGGS